MKDDKNSISKGLITSLIDLTSLNDLDSNEVIDKLCDKRKNKYGDVAALCIYPKFISRVKNNLKGEKSIKIATVVNFPSGDEDLEKIKKQIDESIGNGANEIDIVLPYKEFIKGNIEYVSDVLNTARELCQDNVKLKVIIETGYLKEEKYIREASRLVIKSKADFIKTSTGKLEIGATLEAATYMLEEIRSNYNLTGKWIGFKAAGGIKKVDQAENFISLALSICGSDYVNSNNFRIGASSLMDNLLV